MRFMGEEVLTLPELKAFMQCGDDKIRAMVRAGQLPAPVRAGRRLVWFKSALDVATTTIRKATSEAVKKSAVKELVRQ